MVRNFGELVAHVGHAVAVVTYGTHGREITAADNVAVECGTCATVLLDFDNEDEQVEDGNAGCDSCGNYDRVGGGRVCEHCALDTLAKVLLVMVLDRKHRAWMVEHDPMALGQAEEALADVGRSERLGAGSKPR